MTETWEDGSLVLWCGPAIDPLGDPDYTTVYYCNWGFGGDTEARGCETGATRDEAHEKARACAMAAAKELSR